MRDAVPSHHARRAVRARARARERLRLRDVILPDRDRTRAFDRASSAAAAVAAVAVRVGGVDVTQRRDVTSRAARGEGARARASDGAMAPYRRVA